MDNYKVYLCEQVNARREEVERGHPGYDFLNMYGNQLNSITDYAAKNQPFLSAINLLKEKSVITRADIAQLYREGSLYEAFVATILWGHLNLANIYRVIDQDVSVIEEKLRSVKQLIDNDQIQEAFVSMCSQKKNKINGLGISFFTKVLYFMGYDKTGTMPLVYDMWTQCVHAALIQSEGGDFKEYFTITCNQGNGNLYAPKFKRKLPVSEMYMEFIRKMAQLSNELQISRPDKLEEFVFGVSIKLKKEWKPGNLRHDLCLYLSQFLE